MSDVQTRYRDFTPRQEAIVRSARESVPEFIGELVICNAALPADQLGTVEEGSTGTPIVMLDLDRFGLPEDVVKYLVLHELAHVARGHLADYRTIRRLSAADQRVVKDALEAVADLTVEREWGLGAYLDAWRRCFPEDEQVTKAWQDRAFDEAEQLQHRLARVARPRGI